MSLKKLESIRASIASKRAEIAELQHAPLQPAEVESRVDYLIEVCRDQTDLSWLGRQLVDPRDIDRDDDILATAAAGSRLKTTALFALLAPDALRSVMIESAMPYSSVSSPSQAERIAKQQQLEAEVHALEIDEERTIVALEAAGVEVFRRPDFDPSIVLAVTTT